MKIVAFTDVHGNANALKKVREKIVQHSPDVVVCAGDMTWLGTGLKRALTEINELHPRVLLVHGNHESSEDVRSVCAPLKNITFLHKRTLIINEWLFVGFGGGGFSSRDDSAERFMHEHSKELTSHNVVLITHGPPFGTTLDNIDGRSCGNQSFRKIIEQFPSIKLAISGHLHDTFKATDQINNATLINPGPDGEYIEL